MPRRPLAASQAPLPTPPEAIPPSAHKLSDLQRVQRTRAALRHLIRADAKLATLIRRVGPHRPIIHADPFRTLVGSIIHQQVSMAAAATIQRRVAALCPRGRVTAAALLSLRIEDLRGAGVSRKKASYLHDLAAHFADRRLTAAKLRAMDDEAAIAAVSNVHGIGRWTAEMLLMFCLERPDVWPIDDLGIRKAVRLHLERDSELTKAELLAAGDLYRPYRSYASWYLWRSLEGPLMPGITLPEE